MSGEEFTPADLEHMERLGITEAEARRQLAIFKKGPRNPRLQRPCTLGDGIVVLDSNDHERLVARWEKAAAKGRLSEFVPASGAATRMFAFLQRVRSRLASTPPASGVEGDIETDGDKEDFRLFIDSLREFAFFEPLTEALAQAELVVESEGCEIAHALGVEDAVQMIAFVLHHPRVEILRLALEAAATGVEATIAYTSIAGHETPQPGDAEARFPAIHHLVIERLDFGVD